MTTPPRRQIEPLAAPPGSFDTVLGRARVRRYRRMAAVTGVAGVFLAGVSGGLAMSGGVTMIQDAVYEAANFGGDQPSPGPSTVGTQNSHTPTVESPTPDPTETSTPVVTNVPPAKKPRVRGVVFDLAGAPVPGMFVYTGRSTSEGFAPNKRPADVTGANGRFSLPCTGGPVLLTPWQLNTPLGPSANGQHVATFVQEPACSRTRPPQVTTVHPGGVVTGEVRTLGDCDDVGFPLWLWLDGNRTTTVRLSGVRDGDVYRFSGVPAGTAVLGAKGSRTPVEIDAATTLTQDVRFTCPGGGPDPSESPSPTLTPLPTPSESTTTEPEPDPSDPTPSPSSSN